MALLVLLAAVLVSNSVRAQIGGSAKYTLAYGKLDGIDDSDKTVLSAASAIMCSFLAVETTSNVFCYDGTSCVIVDVNPPEMFDADQSSGIPCYWTDRFCKLPYMFVANVGCIFVNINNNVDYVTSKTSCHGPAELWYPKNDTHAENMRLHLFTERYSALSGPCGPTLALPDGQPGACTSKFPGNHCCKDGQCTRLAPSPCDCADCVDYSVAAKGFWMNFEKIGGVWTYGDGRTEHVDYGVLPWGRTNPTLKSDCAAMYMSPAAPDKTFYQFAVTETCTEARAYICEWPQQT